MEVINHHLACHDINHHKQKENILFTHNIRHDKSKTQNH